MTDAPGDIEMGNDRLMATAEDAPYKLIVHYYQADNKVEVILSDKKYPGKLVDFSGWFQKKALSGLVLTYPSRKTKPGKTPYTYNCDVFSDLKKEKQEEAKEDYLLLLDKFKPAIKLGSETLPWIKQHLPDRFCL